MKIPLLLMFTISVMMFPELSNCDINEDRNRCGDPLIAIATCLPFVTGEAKVPTMDCCTGFKHVLQQNPECICVLIKDRDDPSLGLHINVILALSLPQRCKINTRLTVADCPSILHLPPNSPKAQIFQQFGSIDNQHSGAAPSPAPSASAGRSTNVPLPTTEGRPFNDAGSRKSPLSAETVSLGVLVTFAIVAARILA